jgi:nitrite reductase (NADH) small subunit
MADWIHVAAATDCPPGTVIERLAGERIVAIANIDGHWHALDGLCAHQGGPLGQGTLCGTILSCPWHGWEYDATTGQHCTAANVRQPSFPVENREGELYVCFTEPLAPSMERP